MDENSTMMMVARLAVTHQMVSQDQVDECLRLIHEGKSRLPIQELLFSLGLISGDQFKTLMVLQRAAGADKEDKEEQALFGRMVLSRGLTSPEQLSECLREQARLEEQGIHKNLGELMIAKEILTPTQVKSLVETQNQTIMLCPRCGAKYNVLTEWVGKSSCPQDHEALIVPDSHATVGVVATLDAESLSPDSPIGMDIGGCKVIGLIARGSMGAVYKARHMGLNRMVAVKLLPSVSNDPILVKRLLFEARAIAKLEHPNIVQVYDVGFHQGYFFIVMQLLSGQTLTARLDERGTLPELEATAIAYDIAQGLLAAHGKGIIHRDLKPDNVILTEEEKAKITDFGLAQDTENPDEKPGLIVGTPYYMSPEQWLGHKADERSDLYSLGVILYLLVTGRRPFEGDTVDALMHQHLKIVPKPAHSANESVSEGLSAVIRKLLAKSPQRRYANAAAFLDDIERHRRGEDPEAMQDFGRMVRCGFCETLNPATEKKCKICGESLRSIPASEIMLMPMADEFKCPGCGGFAKKGARACGSCHKPFCNVCKKRIAVLRGHCEYCVGHLRRR